MQTETKCLYCNHRVVPASDGTCPKCTQQLTDKTLDPDQELQFYCRQCDEFFFDRRDENGLDQARCPTCESWCFTPEFEAGEMLRSNAENEMGLDFILKVLFFLAASGLGWATLTSR